MKLNDYSESLPAPAQPQPKKINLAVLLIVASVFITVPVCIFALGYLWLTQSSFNSVNEIKADEVDEIKVQMLNLRRGPQNRPDPITDEKLRSDENTPYHTDPDIDPTLLIRPDFDAFLGSLRGAEQVDRKDVPAVAYLGKIEVRFKDGRRGTILLKQSDDYPGPHATVQVWMNINSNWYRAGTLKDLRTVAQACADRGQKVPR
jgi:hypothetical protein